MWKPATTKGGKIFSYILAILLPLGLGALSGWINQSGMEKFQSLNLPPLSPPGIVFPIAWSILYVLMGTASWLIYQSDAPDRIPLLRLYLFQLLVNITWVFLFFTLNLRLFAFFWLLFLFVLVVVMAWKFYSIHKAATWLLIPYILWLCFAGYLNFSVWLLNRK